MTVEKLQEILQSDETLTLEQIKQIIYELKNDCVVFKQNPYEAGFYNGQLNAFYICSDLLYKLDLASIGLEKRVLQLENWREKCHLQQRVQSLFANMHYGKLGSKEIDYEYYRMKINEIFGTESYQDTDSVRQDGYTTETSFTDESWKEDARRRGEKV